MKDLSNAPSVTEHSKMLQNLRDISTQCIERTNLSNVQNATGVSHQRGISDSIPGYTVMKDLSSVLFVKRPSSQLSI